MEIELVQRKKNPEHKDGAEKQNTVIMKTINDQLTLNNPNVPEHYCSITEYFYQIIFTGVE